MTDENPRLRWLLRRGMKELDIVVTRYYDHHFATASETERAAFVSLLETAEEPDIWAWVMDYAPVPPQYADVIRQFRVHV